MLKNINLQLFADDDEIEIDDIEIEDDSVEIDLEDAEDEEIEVEEPEVITEKVVEKEKKQDVVSKKAFLAERKKFQKREKALKQLVEELKGQTNNTNVDPDVSTLVNETGLDENIAKAIAKIANKDSGKADSVEKLVNKKFADMEFERLKDNPDYADIEEYRDEVEELASKTGLNLKQSYNALFGDEKREKTKNKLRHEIEQEILDKEKKRQGYNGIDTTNNGDQGSDVKTSKYKLSKDEIDIAKAVGMTAKEYYMSKNTTSAAQLGKIFKKKKG